MFQNVEDSATALASSVTPSSCHLLLKEKEKGNAVYFGEGDKESDGIRNLVGVRWKEIETLPNPQNHLICAEIVLNYTSESSGAVYESKLLKALTGEYDFASVTNYSDGTRRSIDPCRRDDQSCHSQLYS